MRLHVLGLPWTATTPEYLTCAYTQKLVKFCRMMEPRGHELYLYATEENEAPCEEHVALFSEEERHGYFGEWGGEALFRRVTWDNKVEPWVLFNHRAIEEIRARAEPHDLVLLVGGNCQRPVADALRADLLPVEPFVGYEGVMGHAAFESHAWRSHVYGLMGLRNGRWYDATIPNYFDPDEFPDLGSSGGDYLLFVGRLVARKGPDVAAQIAAALGMPLVVAGPGAERVGDAYIENDEVRVECPELTYVGEVGVEERARLMHGAAALLAPTLYIEPFGGVAVEAMLCGTPVVGTNWGAFTETIVEGVSGYRMASTLGSGIDAVLGCLALERDEIRDYALGRYSLEAVAPQFERWFSQLDSLWRTGWPELSAEVLA